MALEDQKMTSIILIASILDEYDQYFLTYSTCTKDHGQINYENFEEVKTIREIEEQEPFFSKLIDLSF